MAEVSTRADAALMKMLSLEGLAPAIAMAACWVLSPSSARKRRQRP